MGKVMIVAGLVLVGMSTAALAQRDPAYQAARDAGQVGEQPDGYLGVVGAGNATLRAMVSNINIQRKATYTQKAAAANVTVIDQGLTFGCNLIAQTKPGEKYMGPDGSWKTRTAAPPERDARCP
ncbi:YdbL family protein [Sphingomonas sp. So64.6b]|uniref:YdbL family protein n=1 Tax=Sphingomonas sp. So64.6b TaxID=2997354 RepID=UPI0016000BB0|nr:YdbL family protein [Sphingomonas sp. So64.6b]QNA86965.1 YdbL family protein [Sphingomonas sp. So64.6b]